MAVPAPTVLARRQASGTLADDQQQREPERVKLRAVRQQRGRVHGAHPDREPDVLPLLLAALRKRREPLR
jgi:hypothetical protein